MFEALLASLGVIATSSLLRNGQQSRKLIALEIELAARPILNLPIPTFEPAAPTRTLEQPGVVGSLAATQILRLLAVPTILALAMVVCGIWCLAGEDPYGLSAHDVEYSESIINEKDKEIKMVQEKYGALQKMHADVEKDLACHRKKLQESNKAVSLEREKLQRSQRTCSDLQDEVASFETRCQMNLEDMENLRNTIERKANRMAKLEQKSLFDDAQINAMVPLMRSRIKGLNKTVQKSSEETERLANEIKTLTREIQEPREVIESLLRSTADDNVAESEKTNGASGSGRSESSPESNGQDGWSDCDSSDTGSNRLDEDRENGHGDIKQPDTSSSDDEVLPTCSRPSISSSGEKNDGGDQAKDGDDHSNPSPELGGSPIEPTDEDVDNRGDQSKDSDTTNEDVGDQKSGESPSSDSKPGKTDVGLEGSRFADPTVKGSTASSDTNENVGDQKNGGRPDPNNSDIKEPPSGSGRAPTDSSVLESTRAGQAPNTSSDRKSPHGLGAWPLNGGLSTSKWNIEDDDIDAAPQPSAGGRTSSKQSSSQLPPSMPKAMRRRGRSGPRSSSTGTPWGEGSRFPRPQRARYTPQPPVPGSRHWRNCAWKKQDDSSVPLAPTPAPGLAPNPSAPRGQAAGPRDFSKEIDPGLGKAARAKFKGPDPK